MTLTITIHPEQLNAIRENLNLPDDVSDERCVEILVRWRNGRRYVE